ncbi:tetratricopeptide repeat protein [Mucilaginibacter gilvus]|nr:tetratricopeptide repeat protein [Mucilaginibacter gilvus]
MPTPFKLIPACVLLCLAFVANAAIPVDTIIKRPVPISKTMSYQVSDFSVYFKEGIASIRKDSMDKGVKLLSTGFGYVLSKGDIQRVLSYQLLELIDLIDITARGKLSPAEVVPMHAFLKGVFADSSGNIVKTVLPYINKAPSTTFVKRLKLLLQFDTPDKINSDLNKLLIEKPDLLGANLLKAEILFGQDKFAETVGYCTKVISLSPQYAHAYHLRAKSYEGLKLHSKALVDYDQTIKLFPAHFEAFYERADIYMDEDKYRQAINGYLQTLAIVNNYKWCHYNLARAYKDVNMTDSAMFYINLHLNTYKEDADGFNIKGEIFYAMDDYPAAIAQHNRAIAYNPNRSDFYEERGDAYFYAKDITNAMVDFKKAFSMDKNNKYLMDRIGNCYHSNGDEVKAISWYQAALKINPNYKYAYVDMDISLNKLGRYKEAIAALEKAVAIDSTYAIANGNMGWDYYCLGNYDACIKHSYKALNYQEDATYAMFNIALATLAKGDFEKARELYTQFVKTCKEKNYPINDGAITDLNDLIKKKIMVKEATYIIENILRKTD